MITMRVRVTSSSDAAGEGQRVSERLRAEGLPKQSADGAAAQVEAIIQPMIVAARVAASSRARLELTQAVTGPGYSVSLEVDEGRPPSLIRKALSALAIRQ